MPTSKSGKQRSIRFSTAVLLMIVVSGFSVAEGAAAAPAKNPASAPTVTSSTLGEFSPTFVGPAATGCTANGCSLLTGPFFSPSTEPLSQAPALNDLLNGSGILPPNPRTMPEPKRPRPPIEPKAAAAVTPPTVSCQPQGPGCDFISSNSGGATGVKGLNAVDSAAQVTNTQGIDIEPPDQGLCAGNGFVVEANNLGEIQVFDTALNRASAVISFPA